MPYSDKPAFRCRTCGHLEAAEHAGHSKVPHACSVCGSGVRFGADHAEFAVKLRAAKTNAEVQALIKQHEATASTKTLCPDNWEVLADASEERLMELDLEPHQVERHVPTPNPDPNHAPKTVVVMANDAPATKDSAG